MTRPVNLAELKANANAMSGRLKIMSHPERLIMLCRLDEGEAQSAVSQHLALLREEDIVTIRGEAQTRFYSLKDPVVRAIIHSLCDICAETCA